MRARGRFCVRSRSLPARSNKKVENSRMCWNELPLPIPHCVLLEPQCNVDGRAPRLQFPRSSFCGFGAFNAPPALLPCGNNNLGGRGSSMFIVHSEAIIHLVRQAQQLVRSEAREEGKSDHIPPSPSLSASAHPSIRPLVSKPQSKDSPPSFHNK